jgi:hypothetical protein
MLLSQRPLILHSAKVVFCRLGVCLSILFLLSGCTSNLIGADDPEPRQRSGQCKIITVGEYEELLRKSFTGQNFAIFSKIKNDREPKGPFTLASLRFDFYDKSGTWGVIYLNGIQVDAADTFFETKPGIYENLTKLIHFPSCAGRIVSIQQRLLFKK